MKVEVYKTKKIRVGDDLYQHLGQVFAVLPERSVVIITSKIVSICEGSVVDPGQITKEELIKSEADMIFEGELSYGMYLTIKNNIIIPNAGIDESNTADGFVLWPKDPQRSANKIRKYLMEKLGLKELGVIISDSKTIPMQRGTTGVSLAHSGFMALNNYIGKEDLFGRELMVSMSNVANGMAAAGVMMMGEGSEQTPLAVITDLPNVEFNLEDPDEKELGLINIQLDEDIYAPILTASTWKQRDHGKY